MPRRPCKGMRGLVQWSLETRGVARHRHQAALIGLVATVALAGCGTGQKAVQPILNAAQTGRDAQAFSSLEQAIVTVALVRSEAGGSAGTGPADLAARLQGRNPSVRFAATPSGGPEEVQVVGGGPQPVMLVAKSQSGSHLAVWDNGGGATLYYRGEQPPAYTVQAPGGAGWSNSPNG
jgi:hypothetical protein